MANKKSAKTLAASARKNQIFQLKLLGYNEVQIAENMNLTLYRVRKDFKEALKEVNDETADRVKTIRDTTNMRYENLLRQLYAKIKYKQEFVNEIGQKETREKLDYDAINAILKIIEGQRKLFGIDSGRAEINIDARQQTFTIDENFDYRSEMEKKWNNLLRDTNVVDSTTN